MAKKEAENGQDKVYPPYIPYKSFDNYVAGLKKVGTPPHTLDSSTRPSSMSGGMWRSLVSGLRFLKLIEDDGKATEKFYKLVKAHGGNEWPSAVKQYVIPAYNPVIGDMPLENATVAQLDARFRAHSKIDGQLLRRAERFYLHALRVAGSKFSPLFAMRRESSGGGKRRNQTKKDTDEVGENGAGAKRANSTNKGGKDDKRSRDDDSSSVVVTGTPKGMIDVPLPIADMKCFIRVPLSITTKQMPLVQAAIGMVAAMAAQNDDAD